MRCRSSSRTVSPGLLVTPNDVGEWRAALERLTDDAESERLGARAWQLWKSTTARNRAREPGSCIPWFDAASRDDPVNGRVSADPRYHAVSASWRSPLAVSPAALRRQCTLLRSRGFTGLTFTESERRRREGRLPERCVVVTFDDGYASTLQAKGILDEAGFSCHGVRGHVVRRLWGAAPLAGTRRRSEVFPTPASSSRSPGRRSSS